MSVKYTYSISGDFPNGAVASSELVKEISASAISVAVSHINTGGDSCFIFFKSALSAEENTTLDGLVAAHQGTFPSEIDEPLRRRDEDDFLWVAVNNFPQGVRQQLVGYGDDITNGIRGAGQRFVLSGSTIADHTVEWQFKDLRYVIGGTCEPDIASVHVDDVISMEVYGPATPSTSTPGTGNCNKVEVATGLHVYVPTPDNDGAVTVDLTAPLNANVSFTQAVPVPATSNNGFFDYIPLTNELTPNYSQLGGYNLYDFPVDIGHLVYKIPVSKLSQMNLQVQNVVSTPVLAQWVYRVTYTRAEANPFTVRWWLATGAYDIRVP